MRSPYSGKLIPSKRELLWLHEGRVCHWCNKPTRYAKGNAWDVATIDHVIPRYKGGTNDESNLVSACLLCNNRRSYEDTLGLPDGSLLGHYPVPRQRGLHRKSAMMRHAFNIAARGGTQMQFPEMPKIKSLFDTEMATYNRGKGGSGKFYRFDIEGMPAAELELLDAVETILFRLASEVRQKTDDKLKAEREPLANDEIESLKATVAELRKKIEGDGSGN